MIKGFTGVKIVATVQSHAAKHAIKRIAQGNKVKVTQIQIFEYEGDDFSANIVIDDKFMIQLGTDGEFSIPAANLAAWGCDEAQDYARDHFNEDEIAESLEIPSSKEELIAYGNGQALVDFY